MFLTAGNTALRGNEGSTKQHLSEGNFMRTVKLKKHGAIDHENIIYEVLESYIYSIIQSYNYLYFQFSIISLVIIYIILIFRNTKHRDFYQ